MKSAAGGKRKGTGKWRSASLDDAVLLVFALLIRIAYGLSIRESPLFDFPQVDARLFWEGALAITRGTGVDPVFYQPPFLSALLSLSIRIFGENAGAARFFLLALSAVAAPLAARFARPFLGRGGALFSGALVSLSAPALFYGAEILPASTVLVLNLLLLVALARAEERNRPVLYGACGILLGLSALARPTILVFLPLLLIRYRKTGAVVLFLVAGTGIGLLPAMIHNIRGGDFVPVSSNGGINFYMGNHDGSDGMSARARVLPNEPGEARRAARAIAESAAGGALRPSEVSSHWFGLGLRWVAENPGDAITLTLRRLYYLVNDTEISDNIDFRAMREESSILRFLPIRFGILFGLAIPGLFLLRRKRRGTLLLLYGLAVALPPLLFFMVGRFRFPLLPVMVIAAAAGFIMILERVRSEPARAAGPLLLVAAGLFLSFSSYLGVGVDRVWHYHYLCGDAQYRSGCVDEAAVSFERSFELNSSVPMTRNALGYLYAETGRNLDRAEELVRGAMAMEPGRRRFYLDSLGWILYRKGKLDAAAALFEEAIPLFATGEEYSRAEAIRHLAEVRQAEGDRGDADSLRAEAAQAGPR